MIRNRQELRDEIFDVSASNFNALAIEIFHYQFLNNRLYQKYCQTLYHRKKLEPKTITDIPFLPVEFFKMNEIQTGDWNPECTFLSSSTAGIPSAHLVKEIGLYRESFTKCFQLFYGKPTQYAILGLLPSYLEREGSSLIHMLTELMTHSQNPDSGFYLNNHTELAQILSQREQQNIPTILYGVTFGLLDFARNFTLNLSNTIVIETGGMKGRGKEPIREEVHHIIRQKLGPKQVHSEYGMTELLSQAYMVTGTSFNLPNWMKALVREQHDPLSVCEQGKGMLNFIDLANIDSCCFLATKDMGEVLTNNTFSVVGRSDNSEQRGCNLMVAEIFHT